MSINKHNLVSHREVSTKTPTKGKSGLGCSVITVHGEVILLAPNRRSLEAAFNKIKPKGTGKIDFDLVKSAVLLGLESTDVND